MLTDKVAIITGAAASRGIGLATARLFAEHGARVALIDKEATSLDPAVNSMGSPHRGYLCDVSSREQCQQTVDQIAQDFGAIHILVNNAGVVHGTPFSNISETEYAEVMGVNLNGNFHMAQAAVPHIREVKEGGAIVCISSIAGQNGGGIFGRSHYAASKAGIMGFAKSLARELAPEGIRVNAIASGTIDNDFTRGKMTPEIKKNIAAMVPMGRLGQPREIANTCLYLCSDMSSYVTGTVIDVNGGLLIH